MSSICGPLDRGMIKLQLCLRKLSHKETLQQTLQQTSLLPKTAKSRFVPPFGGLRGHVHDSSMARWKACGQAMSHNNKDVADSA